MEKSEILSREWLSVFLVIGAVSTLLAASKATCFSGEDFVRDLRDVAPPEGVVQVIVEGAVERPGVYYFPPGVRLEEVLQKASLSLDAERSGIKFKKVIRKSRRVVIHKTQVSEQIS